MQANNFFTLAQPTIRDLENKLDVANATIERLTRDLKYNLPVGIEHIVKETDDWQWGVTETVAGSWSSVWMRYKKPLGPKTYQKD